MDKKTEESISPEIVIHEKKEKEIRKREKC
jgi:hypothetical protein